MIVKLFKDSGLKLLSLGIAFLAWFIIMNISVPITSATVRNVPVNVVNASYLESMMKSYRIVEGYDTVSVTVRGSRSAVEKLNAGNISVTADLTQIVNLDAVPVMVPVTVSASGINMENISAVPGNISLEIEDMVNRDFVITPSAGGTSPANRYEVGKMTVSPEKLTVRGPQSLVDKIDRVVARVDVSHMIVDAAKTPQFFLYDKNGEVLSDSQMSYLTLSVEEEDTTVWIDLYKVVSDIEVKVLTSGTPEAGYQVGSITVTPSEIAVVGDDEALELLKEDGDCITITADSGAVDVAGMSSDFDVNTDIREFLPKGISLAQDSSYTVVVTVQILPFNSKSVTIDPKNITVRGLSAGMNCVFGSSKIEVKVMGADEDLEELVPSDIKASVNVSGLVAGQRSVPIDIVLPSGLTLVENPMAAITLSKTETAS
ncbi:MAG: hypothetical protein K6E30_09530 [Lachnospiraceae bacterium]|nr:hypothetical protein [Lachnospiraceae bacterium]